MSDQPGRNELLSVRDTVESIGVAIILAFVVRAYSVEAFVIPTGSMAPRLMGQHVEVQCPDCGMSFPFGVNLSRTGQRGGPINVPPVRCPNCGCAIPRHRAMPRNGDRVLVLKYLFQFRDPQRWSVVVFKDPQGNNQNYIKRLAGLPGEVVRIIHGDVFVHRIRDLSGDGNLDEADLLGRKLTDIEDWQLARKSHATQQSVWQLVYDNDFHPAGTRRGLGTWQELWVSAEQDPQRWDLQGHGRRVFSYNGSEPARLDFARDNPDVFLPVNSYNNKDDSSSMGKNDVCSDLKLETTVLPKGEKGALRLTLSNFEHEFAGEIDFDGTVRLRHRVPKPDGTVPRWEEADDWGTVRRRAFQVGRSVPVALTHADWQVTLWVDGEPVLTSSDKEYNPNIPTLLAAIAKESPPSVPRVGLTALGGIFQLWHTRVMRDVYYTCGALDNPPDNREGKYALKHFASTAREKQPGWGTRDNPIVLRRFKDRPDFDEFYMLGDNSPSSLDSRLWVRAAPTLRLEDDNGNPMYRLGTVPRYNLIGKAFFVYWPAGREVPWLPPERFHLPIIPNVGKMRRIR